LPGELVTLIIGWLLGLFSPIIAGRFQRARDVRELMAAISGELGELRLTMAILAEDMHSRSQMPDDSFLNWLIATVKAYNGSDPDAASYLAIVESARALPADKRLRKAQGPGRAAPLKQYQLPLLAANFPRFSTCPIDFQRRVGNIKRTLDNYNADVEFLRAQFDKTFDGSLSPINYNIVQATLDEGYQKVSRTARYIADQIGEVLSR
jgi:hypothetical protein